ncbi:hypothetical protein [Gilliamella sp. Bif1-4]|jgi:glycerol dehydrogenase-like iron-containing ADH family enzyme|uniref:hypothetical protein n=1 Tax=Gilliamella sp. Bif1-4 TaxID=3120233 RepID=UPI00159EDC8B|nr:hypothetical protein [Gilliamella apicola]
MLIDSDSDMIETVYTFCESVNLPTTLTEIGLANVSDESRYKSENTGDYVVNSFALF